MIAHVTHGVLVLPQEQVADQDGLARLAGVDDGGVHPGGQRHRQENVVDGLAIGQAKGDVARAADRVAAELLRNPAHQVQYGLTSAGDCARGHHKRVDQDIFARNAVGFGPLHDPLGDLEAYLRVGADARLVVGDGDDRALVLRHQRQHLLHPLFFARDRVDERPAAGGL